MPLWIPIAFLAVILWVLGNLIDKYLVEKFRHDEDADTDSNTLFLFSTLFAVPTALFALIMGASFYIPLLQISIAVCAGILNGIYLLLYLHAIAKTELSRVAPVFQSVPIFTALFSWLFLHEILTGTQIIAGLFVISGAVILSYHKSHGRFAILPMFYILVASAAVALQFVLFKSAAVSTSYWSGVLWSSVGLMLFGLCLYAQNKRSRHHFNHIFIQRHYRLIGLNLFNELIDNAAMLTYLFATLLGPIALVQTVNAYHPAILFIITAIASHFNLVLIKEDYARETLIQKAAGIVLIGIGSALIYIPLIHS